MPIHIDSKITIWDRFSVDDEHKEELMEFLKQNPGASASDILEAMADQAYGHTTLVDTGEELTPEGNGGEATVEVVMVGPTAYLDPIWTNKPKVVDFAELICDLVESASDAGCDRGIAVVDSDRINALMEAIGKEPPFPKSD